MWAVFNICVCVWKWKCSCMSFYCTRGCFECGFSLHPCECGGGQGNMRVGSVSRAFDDDLAEKPLRICATQLAYLYVNFNALWLCIFFDKFKR